MDDEQNDRKMDDEWMMDRMTEITIDGWMMNRPIEQQMMDRKKERNDE